MLSGDCINHPPQLDMRHKPKLDQRNDDILTKRDISNIEEDEISITSTAQNIKRLESPSLKSISGLNNFKTSPNKLKDPKSEKKDELLISEVLISLSRYSKSGVEDDLELIWDFEDNDNEENTKVLERIDQNDYHSFTSFNENGDKTDENFTLRNQYETNFSSFSEGRG